MPTHQVAVLAGDGIGPEVIEPAVGLIDAALFNTGEGPVAWERFPWGAGFALEHGRPMPKDGIRRLREFDAIFLGAVGHPKVPDYLAAGGLLLPIRRELDLAINKRPSQHFPGVASPLRSKGAESIDLVIFRENTEGEYADVGGRIHRGRDHEVAIQSAVFSRFGVERIVRAAFEEALLRKQHVTSISKANALSHSMLLWDEVFAEVATDYPGVTAKMLLVDAAAMELVRRPEQFDVLVASNLFGDILSDLAAAVTGGLGLAPSANLSVTAGGQGMFEPVHGSAPDIAGKGIANPIGAILAGAMLLEHLGFPRASSLLRQAVRRVLRNPRQHTPDLGGVATTQEVAQAVQASLAQ